MKFQDFIKKINLENLIIINLCEKSQIRKKILRIRKKL